MGTVSPWAAWKGGGELNSLFSFIFFFKFFFNPLEFVADAELMDTFLLVKGDRSLPFPVCLSLEWAGEENGIGLMGYWLETDRRQLFTPYYEKNIVRIFSTI